MCLIFSVLSHYLAVKMHHYLFRKALNSLCIRLKQNETFHRVFPFFFVYICSFKGAGRRGGVREGALVSCYATCMGGRRSATGRDSALRPQRAVHLGYCPFYPEEKEEATGASREAGIHAPLETVVLSEAVRDRTGTALPVGTVCGEGQVDGDAEYGGRQVQGGQDRRVSGGVLL